MPIPRAKLPHRVRVHRRGVTGTDRYGNDEHGYTPDAEPIRARVDPMSSDEVAGDRERITRRYLVLLDPTAPNPPTGSDQLEWIEGDRLLSIDGDVGPAFDLRGKLHHLEAEGFVITGG